MFKHFVPACGRSLSALEKGKAKGKAEIIQALLRGGMRPDHIASMMGMDMTEIAEIQKEKLEEQMIREN